ncbi:MAG: M18 family aminopeptidase [Coriobacteriaceae bacterium]|nr:M18 family aminopeptidase [Coriobacteriaceae bacterium]
MPGTESSHLELARGLAEFIGRSPSMFHTAAAIRDRLDAAGFTYLPEPAAWEVLPGGSYYTVRNNSSVIAWHVGADLPADAPYHFQLTAAHSDSPSFKVKSVPELEGAGESLRLNVEAYGGMIDYSWFDRPLGLAGRVLVREGDRIESRLLSVTRPVALIPSLAIHMNREVNRGFAPNRQVDLCPLFSVGALARGAFDAFVAAELGVAPEQVLARDLFLVNLEAPRIWGAAAEPEFISAPHLDDLMCAYAALEGFLAEPSERTVSVYACFDNEEVGSNTKQGAMSTLLADVLARVNAGLGRGDEDLRRALAGSLLVSCDNAHAVHPSHPEAADEGSRPVLNGGIVIKEAANQHYCTDAFSRAAFIAVCERAGVPYQSFANRSDTAGGSTLGNLSNMQVSMHAVDVGCPQLAMHASYETAGARDVELAVRALAAFYASDLRIDGADALTLA